MKKKMLANLNSSKGLYNSQRVLLKLIDKGLTREDAYRKVQKLQWTLGIKKRILKTY